MKRLAIIGAGVLAKQFYNINTVSKQYKVVGFFDDNKSKEDKVLDLPILGTISEIVAEFDKGTYDCVIMAFGYTQLDNKKILFDTLKDIVPFATLIHPRCVVDPTATIEMGVVIYPGAVVDYCATVKANSVVNINSTIGDCSVLGSHSFVAGNAVVGGFAQIGEKNLIGISACTVESVVTCSGVTLGAGTVVIKNIEKSGLYVGNPARFIR